MKGYKKIPNFPEYLINDKGEIFSLFTKQIIKQNKGRNGYLLATLFKDKKRFRKTIASLVLETFVGPRPKGLLACHRNDDNQDNSLENLAWQTIEENIIDRRYNGGYKKTKFKKGEKQCPHCKGKGKVTKQQARFDV